jgi:hypothetical protein
LTQLDNWVDAVQPKQDHTSEGTDLDDAPMVLTEVRSIEGWPYVVDKASKSGKLVWEQYYERFNEGESPQSIAANPGGRVGSTPIKVKTVVDHLLNALERGKKIDLRRLEGYIPVLTRSEWEQFREAEKSTCMTVAGDPEKSGKDGGKFYIKDILRSIMGDSTVDMLSSERSDSDNKMFAMWCDKLKLYQKLRRIGYEPTFNYH